VGHGDSAENLIAVFDIMAQVVLSDSAGTVFGLDRFEMVSGGRGLEMIKGLLAATGLAGVAVACVAQGVVAAPIASVAAEIASPHARSLERVYY
jgi:hypothetical protein